MGPRRSIRRPRRGPTLLPYATILRSLSGRPRTRVPRETILGAVARGPPFRRGAPGSRSRRQCSLAMSELFHVEHRRRQGSGVEPRVARRAKPGSGRLRSVAGGVARGAGFSDARETSEVFHVEQSDLIQPGLLRRCGPVLANRNRAGPRSTLPYPASHSVMDSRNFGVA
jgi:hypothetical protein